MIDKATAGNVGTHGINLVAIAYLLIESFTGYSADVAATDARVTSLETSIAGIEQLKTDLEDLYALKCEVSRSELNSKADDMYMAMNTAKDVLSRYVTKLEVEGDLSAADQIRMQQKQTQVLSFQDRYDALIESARNICN